MQYYSNLAYVNLEIHLTYSEGDNVKIKILKQYNNSRTTIQVTAWIAQTTLKTGATKNFRKKQEKTFCNKKKAFSYKKTTFYVHKYCHIHTAQIYSTWIFITKRKLVSYKLMRIDFYSLSVVIMTIVAKLYRVLIFTGHNILRLHLELDQIF